MSIVVAALIAGLVSGTAVQEAGPATVPPAVTALAGCWEGTGSVMGKPVSIRLTARPIAENALFLIETKSQATANPADRYAAHLIFGGKSAPKAGDANETISAFWADSFGGDYTAIGVGAPRADGFEVAYAYPDTQFINRWTAGAKNLSWNITARDDAGSESVFATYELASMTCAAS